MTQEIKSLSSQSTARKSANELASFKRDTGAEGEGAFFEVPDDILALREKLRAAQNSIRFLQDEHALMLKGLHEEIERLQELCRDLQFRCETSGCLLPTSEFFQCSPDCLEQKVTNLLKENSDLKRKLVESHQAIDILDQKEKLALWQHHQELEQRDSAILRLEKELEAKCSTISQLTSQGTSRRKKGSFWRRFSFANSNHPSTSSHATPQSRVQPSRVEEHLSREDLPSEMQNSLQSLESQYQSYSSYSSLSDKSVSDDEGFGQRCDGLTVKLPPISNLQAASKRELVRQQLRVKGLAARMAPNTLAIDQRPL
ncbi:CCDC92 domain-containing protein [Caerostris darwini]|uniref:CCDC92 domain-containing protein n=1 Tax=Caerostris darwini TaxID=1538125 RepID=A0AAV4SAZ5_9ARAC|nr:CCDC92 domain-containing protein [Caerostris darwini]